MSQKAKLKEVPTSIVGKLDQQTVVFKRGKFLGRGSFGRCYELITDNKIYAGKVISRQLLNSKSQKDKLMQEITIHSKLKHHNIVRFDAYFSDKENVYVLLELCAHNSLMELQVTRQTVTEPEARYFVNGLVNGCQHLHHLNIVHRDLKLGNLFLAEDLTVKIGDFGLSAQIEYEGQMKTSMCGTPNYISPEVLLKVGHSFSVDVWAIGCILYTLLVGNPPFETDRLEKTYAKICNNKYTIPDSINSHARKLISALLKPDPKHRPTVFQISKFEFFTQGFMPTSLPPSCLTTPPTFNENTESTVKAVQNGRSENFFDLFDCSTSLSNLREKLEPFDNDAYERLANKQLGAQDEDPNKAPTLWVSKWLDYSNKYGFAYQLNDETFGVIFNDLTKISVDPTGQHAQYVDESGREVPIKFNDVPKTLKKRLTLSTRFRSYMVKKLVKAGSGLKNRACRNPPSLDSWVRTKTAIALLMKDGTFQLNFFKDHTKIIVDSSATSVCFIDKSKKAHVYGLNHLLKKGCSKGLYTRLKYAKTLLDQIHKT